MKFLTRISKIFSLFNFLDGGFYRGVSLLQAKLFIQGNNYKVLATEFWKDLLDR